MLVACLLGCEQPVAPPQLELAGDESPFRDSWRLVHRGEFTAYDTDGNPAITELTIGSALGFGDNFVNRGDVIVELDGEPGVIEIELRRFTSAATSELADATLAKLELWAYAGATASPRPRAQMDDADRCDGVDADGNPRPWQDDCAVYVYFDGDHQPLRSGADIRVRLPADYREHLVVATADDVGNVTYPNRGNVCVTGNEATLEVELGSGVAFVTVDASTAYPSCPAALIDACESSDSPQEPGDDPWRPECPCIHDQFLPGGVEITSHEGSAADLTVDVPADLWMSFRGENSGVNTLLPGKHCVTQIDDLVGVVFDDSGDDPNKPWLRSGIANRPPDAPAGGFRIDLHSQGCESVARVESPDDWDPEVDPAAELRGNLEICGGCLADKRCDELLPM